MSNHISAKKENLIHGYIYKVLQGMRKSDFWCSFAYIITV